MSSLQRWRAKDRPAKREARFVELAPAAEVLSTGWALEIEAPNGVSVRVKG